MQIETAFVIQGPSYVIHIVKMARTISNIYDIMGVNRRLNQQFTERPSFNPIRLPDTPSLEALRFLPTHDLPRRRNVH